MKVLVSGATGGLGRNAVDHLLQADVPLRATGRDLGRGSELARLGVDFEPADLARLEPAQAERLLDGVDTVWHCAALSAPWGKRDAFVAANVQATRQLAEAAVRCGISRFVHISTPSLYFDFRPHRQLDESYRPRRYANHYAATKAQAETVIAELAVREPRTTFVILRPRALFGPHDRVILPRLLALLRRGNGVLRLPGGGQALMDMTYAPNVVHAMMLASTASGLRSGQAYNITNQQPIRLAELLQRLIGGELRLPCRIESLPYPLLAAAAGLMEAWSQLSRREPVLTRYSLAALYYEMTLSNARALRDLAYAPLHDLDDGIRLTGRWLRDHGSHHGL